jgi:hypothetical protein
MTAPHDSPETVQEDGTPCNVAISACGAGARSSLSHGGR